MLTPALTITQSASTTGAVPGQQVTFTVTITNTGQTPYTGAVVTVSFAQMFDDAAYDGASANSGTVTYAGPGADLDRGPGPGRHPRSSPTPSR